jgi:hypothetical protein
MKKSLLFSTLLLSLLPNHAEEPKGLFIDPAEAAKADADFSIQGEYAGSIAGKKHGLQLVAEGDGKFLAILYPGGLPGAGWDGNKASRVKGTAGNGKSAVRISLGSLEGTAKDGKVTFGSDSLEKITRTSPTMGAKPPAGAVVLFDGSNTDAWNGSGMTDEKLLKEGQDSKQKFGSYHIHLEFMLPYKPKARGQDRGNSGFYNQSRFEVQVLDSFGLEGENNECGGVYSIKAPDLNMCLPPLVWQTYDIDFTAATFDASGKKTANARTTVKHNGTVIHDNIELPHATTAAPLGDGKDPGPLHLQNHGNPIRYRNIWLVEKK